MHLLKLALQDRSSKMMQSMLTPGSKVLQYRVTRINAAIDRMREEKNQEQKQHVHRFLSLFTDPICMMNLCSTLLQHLTPENKSYICYGTYMALSLHQGLSEEEKLRITKILADKRVMITDPFDCSVLLKHLLSKSNREMTKLIKSSIPCDPSIYEEIKGQLQVLAADETDRVGQTLALIVQNHFTVKTQSDIRGQAMINGFSGLNGYNTTTSNVDLRLLFDLALCLQCWCDTWPQTPPCSWLSSEQYYM